MNKYESVIIINPNVDEAGLKALEEKFTGLINENGKVETIECTSKYEYIEKETYKDLYALMRFVIKVCNAYV